MGLVHILQTAFNAVFPVVILIGLGYFLRRKHFLTEEFVKVGNKLGYNVCLPVMLFVNVYNIEGFEVIQWDIVIYSMVMVIVLFLLGYLSVLKITPVAERRGVILQAVFRSNTAIIGLSLAASLGGPEAVALSSIITAFSLPVLNICAVLALSIFKSDGSRIDFRKLLSDILHHPLIRAIAIGMVFLLLRAVQQAAFGGVVFSLKEDLKFAYTALNNIKSIASPLALIVLGGQFDFSAARGMFREIAAGTLWRVVFAPLIAMGGAVLLSSRLNLGWGPQVYPGLIGLFGSPVAVSSAIMAGQMGGDEQLATQLVVWTHVASIATMFLTVCILMSMGLLVV